MDNLQDAVIQVIEEWRLKRDLSKIQIGMIIAPDSPDPKVAGQKWSHMVKGRRQTGKKRTLSLDELSALADYFMVNPETIIIEARQKMGIYTAGCGKDAKIA